MADMKKCEVKQELDIGPTVLQRPDMFFTIMGTVKTEQGGERPESVEQKLVKTESKELNTVMPAQDWHVINDRSPAMLCQECGQTLQNRSNLQQHKHSCYVSSDCVREEEQVPAKQEFVQPDHNELGTVRLADCYVLIKRSLAVLCQECGQTLQNSSELQQHKRSCNTSRNVRDEAAYDGIIAPAHRSNSYCVTQKQKQYQCAQCEYSSFIRSNITRHIRSHTVFDKPHKCSQCLFSALKRRDLTIHVRTHTGEKPYKCSECKYSASQLQNLKSHLIRKHSKEKPYKCSQCLYRASHKGNLEVHYKTHSAEKPYKCSHCLFRTSHKTSLMLHYRTHTGENPYKCSECKYSASHRNNLIGHLRTHTGEKPYKCSQCLFRTSRKTSLMLHYRTHTGEKPYKCCQCLYSASRKEHLRVHLRTHTGEKPFKCSKCEYSASQLQYLKFHL